MANEENDINTKLSKINLYIKKAERRIKVHEKALERLRGKINEEKRSLDGLKSDLKSSIKVFS